MSDDNKWGIDTGLADVSGACLPAVAQLLAELTTTERLVLRGLCDGQSNKQIARGQGKSMHTVRNQIHSIFIKLSLGNRAEAAARFAVAVDTAFRVEP